MEMKVVAAYLLAVLGGKTSPSAADLKDILGSAPVLEHLTSKERLELRPMVTGLSCCCLKSRAKDITELIAWGREKLASVPSGGGAVAYSAPAVDAGAAAPAAAEQKKEEKVKRRKTQMM
ncbi:hypothetical protein GBA52_027211 [Prunus armeniaca]|nr:hypothetical protein GBA52_027211 [Prunus armeniaca]